jgi:hypothetical protein
VRPARGACLGRVANAQRRAATKARRRLRRR